MNKVRIGILGCADIAKRYSIKAFQAIDNAEVVSIASRDIEKAKEFASTFNIPKYESYDDLTNNPEVDALYIPLPIGLHKEWATKAARAGKHVICEKSLAENFESVKDIVEACEKNGVVLYENFMCDFHPQHEKVLSMIEASQIGEPRIFKGFFGFPFLKDHASRYKSELGSGSLNEVGAYTVFMARKILNKEPVAISAELYFDADKKVDMRGSVELHFDGGVSAMLAFDLDAVYQNHYSIWGSKGLINVNLAYSVPQGMEPKIELVQNENSKEDVTQIGVPEANHFELIFKDFCGTVLDKDNQREKIKNTYAKILAQAKVMEAIRLSAKEKRRVEL